MVGIKSKRMCYEENIQPFLLELLHKNPFLPFILANDVPFALANHVGVFARSSSFSSLFVLQSMSWFGE